MSPTALFEGVNTPRLLLDALGSRLNSGRASAGGELFGDRDEGSKNDGDPLRRRPRLQAGYRLARPGGPTATLECQIRAVAAHRGSAPIAVDDWSSAQRHTHRAEHSKP